MNDKNRTNEYLDFREDGSYRTGSTRPPKNHGGLIAALLVVVILLCGIVSALGLLNVRLFARLQQQPDEDRSQISFSDTENKADPVKPSEAQDATLPSNTADITMELDKSPESVPNIPQEGGLSLQEIYSNSIDSVVSITCSLSRGSSSGTGVILSEDGYLVTNAHVVADAVRIKVELTDGRSYEAALVGADEVSDLAVLYISASGLNAAEFGDSGSLRVGDTVVAIGDPLGAELRGTYTDGIVSAINRDITFNGRTMTLIQTNAALNAGNSGGPLINCYGQVIGINTMKIGDYMNNSGVEGLGFAIPSTTVKEIVDQLASQGYVSGRPSLGISGEGISNFYQHFYQLPAGLHITDIESTSDAALKGLRAGDILMSIDGQQITDENTMNQVLYAHEAGDTLTAIIYRGGRQYQVELTVEESKG